MDSAAVLLVLGAAMVHALWNLSAKRVANGGALFVAAYYTVSAVVCLPLAVLWLLWEGSTPHWSWLAAGAVTAIWHVLYGVLLQRGYAVGDMSVVYPLARGSGPLLTVLAAVLLLGERPGALGLVGALVIVAGVFVISFGGAGVAPNAVSIGYGVATGAAIAGYTLWDAHSVTALAVPPLVYFGLGSVLQSMLLAPYALHRRAELSQLLRAHWRHVLIVGLLSPVAYLLVLYAMRIAPVSMVAPVRETSIVIGAVIGWLVLREPNPARRLVGSVVVLAGVVAIALA
ncbi:EamA-like transporter family protein [Tamaricihabitans halophyticus]|uniref:EamA-like transporter family protein n=1 Tax=Tamaricihabitans halophyticus TaxID=1262583 RepID=A0A4R2R690_9PSEU|nr:DMT family transporter [Tamaricihabitans halophyticus]TCP54865.1 EamA-like transporter family protein [Tamaricihabitans halophyticus]